MTTKRIGVTQRVAVVPDYGERRDCLDQRWVGLLASLDLTAVPLPNLLPDPAAVVDAFGLSGVILSGGNDLDGLPGAVDTAPERDALEAGLIDHCLGNAIPIFGVCRGLQMINHHLGGSLIGVEGHRAERHGVAPVDGETGWKETFEVNSYHTFAVEVAGLAPPLAAMLLAPDGTVEAFRHRDKPCMAVMWHPERETPMTERDLDLMAMFFAGVTG
jgi:gamma-glutamyl-gamma-aminobutyrate hydrolase PuuD